MFGDSRLTEDTDSQDEFNATPPAFQGDNNEDGDMPWNPSMLLASGSYPSGQESLKFGLPVKSTCNGEG